MKDIEKQIINLFLSGVSKTKITKQLPNITMNYITKTLKKFNNPEIEFQLLKNNPRKRKELISKAINEYGNTDITMSELALKYGKTVYEIENIIMYSQNEIAIRKFFNVSFSKKEKADWYSYLYINFDNDEDRDKYIEMNFDKYLKICSRKNTQ